MAVTIQATVGTVAGATTRPEVAVVPPRLGAFAVRTRPASTNVPDTLGPTRPGLATGSPKGLPTGRVALGATVAVAPDAKARLDALVPTSLLAPSATTIAPASAVPLVPVPRETLLLPGNADGVPARVPVLARPAMVPVATRHPTVAEVVRIPVLATLADVVALEGLLHADVGVVGALRPTQEDVVGPVPAVPVVPAAKVPALARTTVVPVLPAVAQAMATSGGRLGPTLRPLGLRAKVVPAVALASVEKAVVAAATTRPVILASFPVPRPATRRPLDPATARPTTTRTPVPRPGVATVVLPVPILAGLATAIPGLAPFAP